MTSSGPQVDVGSLRDQPLAPADMVFRVRAHDGAVRLVARDALSGHFGRLSVPTTTGSPVRGPGVADEATTRLYALSPDGHLLLFGERAIGGARLSLYALATGTVVTLPPGPGGPAIAAAFSPDGKRIAALAPGDDDVTVTVSDIDGGRRRDLWSAAGETSSDVVVSWSPDGRFLGITYVDPDDYNHTVVVDGDGAAVADLPEMGIAGKSRRGWTGEHELLLAYEFWDGPGLPPFLLLDPVTGDRREIGERQGIGVLGALDGRLLRPAENSRRIVSTAFDGSDPRPVVDAGPGYTIAFVDAIPGALNASG